MENKFTIEDIHRIREENYEKTKEMNAEEIIKCTESEADEVKRVIKEIRKKAKMVSGN